MQQEVSVVPASVSFGSAESAPEFERFTLEQTIRVRNVSTRTVVVRVASAALAPKGVVISVDPERARLRPRGSVEIVVTADTRELSQEAGVATGELVLRVADAHEVHVPWAVAVPAPQHIEPHVPRVTLNPRIVTVAREVLVVATGETKAAILREILQGERDVARLPAQLARHDRATWVLDEPAASALDR